MRLRISALFLLFAASFSSLAQHQPGPTNAETKLDSKTKKEVAEMEKQLSLAIAKRDTAFLERILAQSYFDAYEGAKRAISKPGTIAGYKAGMLNFLAIEKEPQFSRNLDTVTVEGRARFIPTRIDDKTPEEQWVHVRRLWEKKDGQWQLTGQFRRVIE